MTTPPARSPNDMPPPAAAGAILTIDLAAIAENYRQLKALVGGVACAAVLKADAYGLGAVAVAPALAAAGCDTFFVAHVAEGIGLRDTLGSGPAIYLLHGIPPGAERDGAAAALRPALNSLEQIAAWRAAAHASSRRLPAVLQIDTDMSRLGLSPAEVARLADEPERLDGITVTLVMSHLACADEPDNPANAMQLHNFAALRQHLPRAPASLSNSSGIFLGAAYHGDLVRPGAALYGINPQPALINPMQPVVELDAKIIQTRELAAGSGIGYGHTFRTSGPLPVATIALGYADGWHRRAAASAFYRGVPLPFVGRVSMDSIVLDISRLPAGTLSPGDSVGLIGAAQGVDAVAAAAGTIGYEVLTSLGKRLHRVYVGV